MRPILLHGHTRALTKVIYNKEGDLLFSAAKDTTPNVWYSHNGELLGSFQGHTGSVWAIDVNEKSDLFITGAGDNTARLWNVQYGKELAHIETATAVRCASFSTQHGKELLVVTDAKMGHPAKLLVYSTQDFSKQSNPIQEIVISGSKITTAAWSIGDKYLYTGHEDGSLMMWDRSNIQNTLPVTVVKEHTGSINDFQMSSDKTFFITASKDHTSKIFDARTLKCVKVFQTERPVNGAAISPTREEVMLGGGQEAMNVTTTSTRAGKFEVRFFHAVYEEEIGRVKGHFGPINTVAYHPSGQGFASGSEDGYIRLHEFDPDYYTFRYDDGLGESITVH